MRIYLRYLDHKTSISVDDQLVVYLQNRIKHRADTEKTISTKTRLWIQGMVDAAGDLLPTKGLSQWVQARIIDAVADPVLKGDAQKAKEAELAERYKNLTDKRWANFHRIEKVRKDKLAKKAIYEKLAKDVDKEIPKNRFPPPRFT